MPFCAQNHSFGVYTLRVWGVSIVQCSLSCGLQPPVAARILCSGRLSHFGALHLSEPWNRNGHLLTHRGLSFWRDLESLHETNLRFLRLQSG